MAKKKYSLKIKVNPYLKNKEVLKAMATAYSSSPYLSKKRKDKLIKDLFKS